MADKPIGAVIIDVVSIQDYIFSSNYLKENVGASYLVKDIYRSVLKEALTRVFSCDVAEGWEISPTEVKMQSQDIPFEIGYIGGGNAVILFREKNDIKSFIKEYTKLLLKRVPGLKLAFGIVEDFNPFPKEGENCFEKLHKSLKDNKNIYFPNICLQKYGFTAECPRTGESAEVFQKCKGKVEVEDRFTSSMSQAKIWASEKAKEEARNVMGLEDNSDYVVTNDIGTLSQYRNDDLNYIAVVHIDGNNIGERFKRCKDLLAIRRLSTDLKERTKNAFKNMVEKLIQEIEKTKDDKEKIVLPIRPIIIGGDDVTFVCDGRLGVWLAEIFIKEFIKEESPFRQEPLSACGGIAIVKAKYPFYRAYKIAEYLTQKAKERARSDKDGNPSYIDFFVSSSGWTGKKIRDDHYEVLGGNLHFGPYRIDGEKDEVDEHIDNLKYIISEFGRWKKRDGKTTQSRNKIMKLREVICNGTLELAERFTEELEKKGYTLPDINYMGYSRAIWIDRKTPYFDAIELLDFYPEVSL